LDTLRLQKSNTIWGHISLYTTLLIGHIKHPGQIIRLRCSFLVDRPKNLQQTSLQDWVFICLPGISESAFQLQIDHIWFCKLHLLFTIETKTDKGMKKQATDFVSVLREFKGHRRPGIRVGRGARGCRPAPRAPRPRVKSAPRALPGSRRQGHTASPILSSPHQTPGLASFRTHQR
jgi:hypothetical protein